MSTLTADEIRTNRLAMILALESEVFQQGRGALSTCYVRVYARHCCIGVQRRISTGEHSWKIGETEEHSWKMGETEEYPKFRNEVGIDGRFQDHLIAMNDGGERYYRATTTLVRKPGNERDFRFIARFLRKAWGMTDA